MMVEFLAKHKDFYRQQFENRFGEPVGSSRKEIDQLGNELRVNLPEAYIEYLLWMGNDHNGIFRGSDWYLSNILANTSYLVELLSENELDPIEEKYVCFYCHQGYVAAWFMVSEDDDPPCLLLCETDAGPKIDRYSSFSDLLMHELRQELLH